MDRCRAVAAGSGEGPRGCGLPDASLQRVTCVVTGAGWEFVDIGRDFGDGQCQNTLGVGASGSCIVTTKLRVPAGKRVQVSCGDMVAPPARGSPSRKNVAVDHRSVPR